MLDVYKYGIGLLKLPVSELEEMPFGDFLLKVDSTLLMEEELRDLEADRHLPFHALFTAFLMQSSGNMKKSFDPLDTAQKLYPSELAWGEESSSNTNEKKDYKTSKEDLMKTFELE